MNRNRPNRPRQTPIRAETPQGLRTNEQATRKARDPLGGEHQQLVFKDSQGNEHTLPTGMSVAILGQGEQALPVYQVPAGKGALSMLPVSGIETDSEGKPFFNIPAMGGTFRLLAEFVPASSTRQPSTRRTPGESDNPVWTDIIEGGDAGRDAAARFAHTPLELSEGVHFTRHDSALIDDTGAVTPAIQTNITEELTGGPGGRPCTSANYNGVLAYRPGGA